MNDLNNRSYCKARKQLVLIGWALTGVEGWMHFSTRSCIILRSVTFLFSGWWVWWRTAGLASWATAETSRNIFIVMIQACKLSTSRWSCFKTLLNWWLSFLWSWCRDEMIYTCFTHALATSLDSLQTMLSLCRLR